MGIILSYLNPINYKELEEKIKPIIKEIIEFEVNKLKDELKEKENKELDTSDAVKAIGIVVLDKLEEVVEACGENSCCK